jgi:flagellar capping protein FliD
MAVMVRETWTDELLDDLDKKVDHGFTKVDARFDRLEARMDAQFGQMNERFDRMQQTLIGSAVVLVALLGILATQL